MSASVENTPTNATSPIAGRSKPLPGWAKLGVAFAACVGVIAWYAWPTQHHQAIPAVPNADGPPNVPFQPPPLPHEAGGAPLAGIPAQHVRRLPAPLELGTVYGTAPPQNPAPLQSAMQTGQQGAGGTYGNAGGYGNNVGGGGNSGGVTPVYVPEQQSNTAPAHPGGLDDQLSGVPAVHVVNAGIMNHPDYTISAGSRIPCLPVDAINSSLGGYNACRVPEWVRGTTQARGLLPPGTVIFGQVRKGLVNGQERLAIVFTRIETAGDHMVINIASPAADEMGRAGADGNLNTHFWSNVGNVALYALIDGLQGAVTNGATAAVNGAVGNGNGFFFSFGGGGQSLASTALQGRLNIPPTLERPEAFPLQVQLGEDLDFYVACQRRMQVSGMACPLQ